MTLILLGIAEWAFIGFVMLRLPIPGFLLAHLGDVGWYVDLRVAPIWASAFLLVGVLLLRRRSRPAAPNSQP
jgi:hypothetical protein